MIFAIDPGTTQSAYAVWDGGCLVDSEILDNEGLLLKLRSGVGSGVKFAIEKIESYGMPVGAEVFETCYWTGRFIEAIERDGLQKVLMVPRRSVKLFLCQSSRAKDGNVRMALIERFGNVGTKKSPGPLYGARSHVWAALAIAVFVYETKGSPWIS